MKQTGEQSLLLEIIRSILLYDTY